MKLLAILPALFFVFPNPSGAQQSSAAPVVQRDPQAVALLQSSIHAMGGTAPTDSTATGTVTIVAGSETSNGTIRILTRGTNETSEQISVPEWTTTVIFSSGLAAQSVNSTTTTLSAQRAATCQSVLLPLPFLAAALANSDESIHYIGLENSGQQSLQHIRIQNTFASQTVLQQFADFAVFDVWLDATTSLPQRISYVRRDGGGAAPRIPVAASFTRYQTISGVAYPSGIQISFNGTPWATITISNVTFNTGLTDSSFPLQ